MRTELKTEGKKDARDGSAKPRSPAEGRLPPFLSVDDGTSQRERTVRAPVRRLNTAEDRAAEPMRVRNNAEDEPSEAIVREVRVLDVYRRPYDAAFPVACMDETPRQLISETREPAAAAPGRPARED